MENEIKNFKVQINSMSISKSSIPDECILKAKKLPKGYYLTVADKLLGIVLMTTEWQLKAFHEQIQAGQSIPVNMTEDEVLESLKCDIDYFVNELTVDERNIYMRFKGEEPRYPRVPLLNMTPKVGKLSNTSDEYLAKYWDTVPARPIRSGSADPLNSPARALKLLLDVMFDKAEKKIEANPEIYGNVKT